MEFIRHITIIVNDLVSYEKRLETEAERKASASNETGADRDARYRPLYEVSMIDRVSLPHPKYRSLSSRVLTLPLFQPLHLVPFLKSPPASYYLYNRNFIHQIQTTSNTALISVGFGGSAKHKEYFLCKVRL